MRAQRLWWLGLATLAACSEDTGICVPDCATDERCVAGACVDDRTRPAADAGALPDAALPDAGPGVTVVGLQIDPPAATLTSSAGSRPRVAFTVLAVRSDGTTAPAVNPTFSLTPQELGVVNVRGVFISNGIFAGAGRVIASAHGFSANAAVSVRIEEWFTAPGTPPDAAALFNIAPVSDPARAADLVYPLDGAVMPQNVVPADVQWNNVAPGDVFRVRLEKPRVRLVGYVSADAADFTASWAAPAPAWRKLSVSESAEDATITVDRYVAADQVVVSGVPVQVRFRRASLLGSIYYWDIARGRIVRINDGTTNREEFLPNPQLGCVGCHSVSADGRYMAGRLGGGENFGAVFDLTEDLTPSPPPTLYEASPTSTHWWFSTWSPDNRRLLLSTREGAPPERSLALMDPFTGELVTPLGAGLPAGAVTHPSWSPDGQTIAYVANTDAWGGANTAGDIYKLAVTGPDTFGPPEPVIAGAAVPGEPVGAAASYPTWSPTSDLIVFAHGTSSRSENGASALYVVRPDGTGLRRLDNANGGPNSQDNFQPNFSPFVQDGHLWLTFLSRRDYGNAQAGTAGTGLQQIWVSAIDMNAPAGADPSGVPYWLPGQNRASRNISAYWAPRACRDPVEACTADMECCTGQCNPETLSCSDVTEVECAERGGVCARNEHCCEGLLCIDGTCGGL